jgi:HSP20 family molecular chaperone IbpA
MDLSRYYTFSLCRDLRLCGSSDRPSQARFDNGILEVELERLGADRPEKIEIRGA